MQITIRYPKNITGMVSLGNVVHLIGIHFFVKKKLATRRSYFFMSLQRIS